MVRGDGLAVHGGADYRSDALDVLRGLRDGRTCILHARPIRPKKVHPFWLGPELLRLDGDGAEQQFCSEDGHVLPNGPSTDQKQPFVCMAV